MKWRGVDHHQQIGPSVFGQPRRLFKPGVFADQQPDAEGVVARLVPPRLEHASALPRREIAALVKHLVIGQLALGVACNDAAFAQHAGGVVALLHRHALGAQALAG